MKNMTRHLWLALLAALTICALLLPCALAEEVVADAVDPVTVEQEGAELNQDEAAESGDGYADFVYEGETEAYVPEEAPMASPASDFVIEDGVLTKYVGPGGDVIIPDGVITIGIEAFRACESLTSVAIPNTVTAIEESAFEFCKKLTCVKFSSGLRKIGICAFYMCTSLKEITLPNTLTEIASGAFQECESLADVVIPDSVDLIGDQVFWNCDCLTTVSLPSRLSVINERLFMDCDGLHNIIIPESVTIVGDGSFAWCSNLTTVYIPSSVIEIGDDAFLDCNELKIETPCGSYAQKWAAENGYAVNVTGHTPVTDPAVAATCTAEGKTEGSHCAVCNEVIVAQTPIPATGHTPVTDPAVAATCTAEGETEGSHCSVCGAVIVAQQVVPATGHTPVVNPAVAPAYGVEGRTEGSHCAVCGAVLVAQQPIPALTYQELALGKVKNNGTITLAVGEQRLIVPAFATAAGWTVNGYKSNKPAVASIDGNGLLTANAEGKAKITVTTNEKKKATVIVKVVDPYKPTAIAIAQGKAVTITMGQPLQLNVGLAPEIARATLAWASNKTGVATVDGNGLVTPQGEGKTKITVRTQNKKKATITVQVVDPNKPLGIAIAQGKAVTMKVGETLQLGVGLNPATAQSALTWKTNKPAIASVDGNGVVTAVKKGKAKITVTTYNKKKATITVNVVE